MFQLKIGGVAQSPPNVINSYKKAGERMSGMHRKTPEMFPFQVFSVHPTNFSGGDKRDRTADLLNAIQALSQLSYTPE